MKILFTLLSIDSGNKMYLESAKRLINEILVLTEQDIYLSTNNSAFFEEITSPRCFIRNNIKEEDVLNYGTEFNYNLKYNAFENLPESYDIILYLDCDIKLKEWTKHSEEYIKNTFIQYDFGATRLNCSMQGSVEEYRKTGTTLFSHKINSYKILEKYSDNDDIMLSLLPSEHFLIFKNDKEKIKKFYQKWSELNSYLQSINGQGGSWGDGFEIGISARYAGYHNPIEVSAWPSILGLEFNGNKFFNAND